MTLIPDFHFPLVSKESKMGLLYGSTYRSYAVVLLCGLQFVPICGSTRGPTLWSYTVVLHGVPTLWFITLYILYDTILSSTYLSASIHIKTNERDCPH